MRNAQEDGKQQAMKMENVLKAQADGVVQNIEVKKGQAVEKNQVLIRFN